MKLFLTASGDSLSNKVDSSFGRCNYFLLYETENDKYEFVENKFQDAQTSVGISVAQTAIDLGAQAVISANPGPKAFNILHSAGISVYYVPEETKLKYAVNSFLKNELIPLDSYLPHNS
jgi:predicted Fe-Mo cluster-binding NifX family protein